MNRNRSRQKYWDAYKDDLRETFDKIVEKNDGKCKGWKINDEDGEMFHRCVGAQFLMTVKRGDINIHYVENEKQPNVPMRIHPQFEEILQQARTLQKLSKAIYLKHQDNMYAPVRYGNHVGIDMSTGEAIFA